MSAHAHTHARDHAHRPPGPDDALRARGLRVTRQRELIWEALTARPEAHVSADEVVERVRTALPRVNPSTVYRTLSMLVDEGLVLRTDLGGDRAYFEPALEHPHHHVVCERCGAVAHVHDDALGDLPRRVRRSTGYRLTGTELTLQGVCPDCQR
jgi:Fe2+ or Zn2+ uptake regulation protein